jgi:hypothetical protein
VRNLSGLTVIARPFTRALKSCNQYSTTYGVAPEVGRARRVSDSPFVSDADTPCTTPLSDLSGVAYLESFSV